MQNFRATRFENIAPQSTIGHCNHQRAHIRKHRPYSSRERHRGPKPELLIGALATSRDPARQYTRLHCSAIEHAVTLVAGKFCDALPVRRDKKRTFPSFKACGGNVTLVVISAGASPIPSNRKNCGAQLLDRRRRQSDSSRTTISCCQYADSSSV